ncbi:MAG: rod-binding protein [Rhodospirillales bacterium]|nr:rod-binding protein [Rhodospirillales bacterium]
MSSTIAPAAGPPASDLPAAIATRLWQSAKNFEAMALGALLKPIFDTVDTSRGPFGGGNGEAAWKPMLVSEIAKEIAAHGGLGLARPVFAQMLRLQEAHQPQPRTTPEAP